MKIPSSAQISLSTVARVLFVLPGVTVCLLILLAFTFYMSDQPSYFTPWHQEQNILDGCRHVYLDMGTNMWDLKLLLCLTQRCPDKKSVPAGAIPYVWDVAHIWQILWFKSIQVTHHKPNQRLRPGAVCSVGWEPNPAHTHLLKSLEDSYNRCGWKVRSENALRVLLLLLLLSSLLHTKTKHFLTSGIHIEFYDHNCVTPDAPGENPHRDRSGWSLPWKPFQEWRLSLGGRWSVLKTPLGIKLSRSSWVVRFLLFLLLLEAKRI